MTSPNLVLTIVEALLIPKNNNLEINFYSYLDPLIIRRNNTKSIIPSFFLVIKKIVIPKIFFIYSSLGLAILCLAVLLYNRKNLPEAFKWLGLFFLNWIIVDIVATVLALYKFTNLPLLHLYTFLEFIIITQFYKIVLNNKKILGISFNHFILAGSLLIIANAIFLQDIFGHNSYAKSFTNLSAITFSLLFIRDLINEKVRFPFKPSISWINSGFTIYYMGIFIIFLISDYLFREEKKLLIDLWSINIALNNILMIILLFGIIKAARIKNKIEPQV